LSFFPLSVFAQQVLRLLDGKTYSGTFVSGDSSGVVFRDSGGVSRRFALNRIESIDFAGSAAADRVGAETEYVIPQGTELSVRTNEAINSKTATQGQTFAATVAQDVKDASGLVVIPRGSPAQLVIDEVKGGGAAGGATFALDLRSVTVNGRFYLAETGAVEPGSGTGQGASTGATMPGGAGLGTLIGAVVGGGKGSAAGTAVGAAGGRESAIGAAIGAAGGGKESAISTAIGAAGGVLASGGEVKVPAETMLTFRLDQPLRLEAAP
jgi:hypothetical protein